MDPILKLLLVGIGFFTAVLLYTQKYFPNDGQTFQVVAGLLTGFAGAFLGFAKTKLGVPPGADPSDNSDAKGVPKTEQNQ